MATENSGAPHLPPSWPEAPRADVPTSWPELPPQEAPPGWPDTSSSRREPPAWPDPPRQDPLPAWSDAQSTQAGQPPWPDTRPSGTQNGPAAGGWPESQNGPASGGWPETQNGQGSWSDAQQGPAPAWPEAQGAAWQDPQGPSRHDGQNPQNGQGAGWQDPQNGQGSNSAWANLSSPAPWPPQAGPTGGHPGAQPPSGAQPSGAYPAAGQPGGGYPGAGEPGSGYPGAGQPGGGFPGGQPSGMDPLDPSTPWPPQAPAQGDPLERTVSYNQAAAAAEAPPYNPQAGSPEAQPFGNQAGGPEAPPYNHPDAPRPGANLSRDPSDPDRPFVTAGQISGSRTPPPERQQELWNTVFGDNYEAIGDDRRLDDDDDEPSRPVWIYALAGSVAIALVAGLVWAFWAGPLASEDPPKSAALPTAAPSSSPKTSSTTPPKNQIPRLPKFPGTASPVAGALADPSAGISVARLGGRWLLDQRGTLIKSTYGFSTRQFVKVGADAAGNPISAQVMTGPLAPTLTKYYTSPDDLEPVIKAVVVNARKKLFPEGNTVKKTAQQALKVGGLPARLIAYEVTAGDAKTTVVVAAVSTGGDAPSIVYMSVPGISKNLLPDVNTVFKSIKPTTAQG
ncbi:hypothetical protein ACIBG8_30045 [Nonomuraea sp. NPDC050556]|uniref:hypothetical protein n=1 Tax=Nonomuraea sp. NPDC050556 TaxID=3364369 RepID=UPI0037AE02CE